MSLPQTFSAALLASTSLLLPAPAVAVVPGSSHYSDRREETERHLVAIGTVSQGSAAVLRRPVPGTAGTTMFGYPASARSGDMPSIGSDGDHNRTGETKLRPIGGR